MSLIKIIPLGYVIIYLIGEAGEIWKSLNYGYDTVFARQVQALGSAGDVLVGLSTSGNSKNVLAAIDVAKTKGIQCIGMTAQGGGKMAEVCDICMAVPCPVTARAQEIHILIGHILCELVDGE